MALLTHSGLEVHFFVKNVLDRQYSTYLLPGAVGPSLLRYVPRDDQRYFGLMLMINR